jgi:hypothetical protein
MIESLGNRWQFTWREVWAKLADLSAGPPDLFIQLFDCAEDFLNELPRPVDSEVLRNDPAKARQAFRRIKGSGFKSEADIVGFLERAYTAIADLRSERLAERYERLIKNFLRRYNLRYRIVEPFKLRSLL